MLKMAQNIFCWGTTEWNTFSWKNKHAVVKGYFVGSLELQKLQVEHKIWIVFHQSLKFDYQLSDYSDYSDLAFTSIIQHKLEKPHMSNQALVNSKSQLKKYWLYFRNDINPLWVGVARCVLGGCCYRHKNRCLAPLLSLKIIYCARALINTSAINPCQFWELLQVNSCKKVMPKVEWWTSECA